MRVVIIVITIALFAIIQPAAAASFQVTGVTPPSAFSCPSAQGCQTFVIVHGQGFNAIKGCPITCIGPAVVFGDQPGMITNITDTQITVLLAVHSPGTVDVTVFGWFDSATLPSGFTYLDPAQVPGLLPSTLVLLAFALAATGWMAPRLP